jgi:hypothetical protein
VAGIKAEFLATADRQAAWARSIGVASTLLRRTMTGHQDAAEEAKERTVLWPGHDHDHA